MFLVIGGLSMMSHHYTLGNIKSRTVGDGQHGTARWATDKEIKQTYAHVPFKVREWRSGQNLPSEQGLILGCKGKPQELTALVDSDDIHCLMIGASGIGKTAFFLYPNLEYACASGMSWLALDSKGDLARNYGTIAKNCYGYNVSVIEDSLCAIMITVLPLISFWKACCNSYSFSGSAAAEASSIMTIFAFFRIALAMAILCTSPPERYTPFAPMTVISRWGNLSRMDVQFAASSASIICCRVA